MRKKRCSKSITILHVTVKRKKYTVFYFLSVWPTWLDVEIVSINKRRMDLQTSRDTFSRVSISFETRCYTIFPDTVIEIQFKRKGERQKNVDIIELFNIKTCIYIYIFLSFSISFAFERAWWHYEITISTVLFSLPPYSERRAPILGDLNQLEVSIGLSISDFFLCAFSIYFSPLRRPFYVIDG